MNDRQLIDAVLYAVGHAKIVSSRHVERAGWFTLSTGNVFEIERSHGRWKLADVTSCS
jgi:hypothetical protein